MTALADQHLMDLVSDAYIDWREQCEVVRMTYRAWAVAPRSRSAAAFDSYLSALDGEQDAANHYAAVIRHASETLAVGASAHT